MTILDLSGARNALQAVGSPLAERVFISKPFVMAFVVTRRCNSRCKMCRIWKDRPSDDLGLEDIQKIFADSFAKSIRFMTLTGGEPTLRTDLKDIVRTVLTSCPNLVQLDLATNGLDPDLVLEQVRRCLEEMTAGGTSLRKFVVQLSLDGLGEVHDQIRGVSGAYDRVLETTQALLKLKGTIPSLDVRFSSVAQPHNLAALPDMRDFADSMGIPVHFSPVILSSEYYKNKGVEGRLTLDTDGICELKTFFDDLAQTAPSPIWRSQYRDIGRMLAGRCRQRRCMMGFYGFVLEHDGWVYPCVNCENSRFGRLGTLTFDEVWLRPEARRARRHLRESCCPGCYSVCYAFPVNIVEVGGILIDAVRRG